MVNTSFNSNNETKTCCHEADEMRTIPTLCGSNNNYSLELERDVILAGSRPLSLGVRDHSCNK